MSQIDCLLFGGGASAAYDLELLSASVFDHIRLAVSAFCDGEIAASADIARNGVAPLPGGTLQVEIDALLARSEAESLLCILAPAPAVSAQTLSRLAATAAGAAGSAVLTNGDVPIALIAPREKLALVRLEDELSTMRLCQALSAVAHYAPDEEKHIVCDTLTAYYAQESIRRRINLFWMERGVLLVDPNTTYISPLAVLGEGTVVMPNSYLNGATLVGESCRIGPNSVLKNARLGRGVVVNFSQIYDCTVGDETTIGPFAHLRPGTELGGNVRVGNFVELKNTSVGEGTKISHLTYLGDSDLGERVNVGCGVITSNYDGKDKHRTTVGDDSFIGCNVNLVPPVKIGRGAYVAAGTTVIEEVPADALAIGRVRQTHKEGWAAHRRAEGRLK